MDPEEQSRGLLAPSVEQLAAVKVFPLIPSLKKDVTRTIDSALSWEQLTASDINFSIVRPLVFKYARLKNMAVVYACLVVRSYFLAEAESDLAFVNVMNSRATLCEIMAMKLLSRFASNYFQLVAVLTTSWNPLAGATRETVHEIKQILGGREDDDVINDPQSALEMAIATGAKDFIASPVSQKVVNGIYSGRVIFSVAASRSMLADNYKPRAINFYDCRTAPFLDHYRLRVPKYGAILEFFNFALLLLTFVLCLSNQDGNNVTTWEIVFIIFATAFALEEYTASKEHGWIIYIANMWNVFDSSFIVIFVAYLAFRVKGLVQDDVASSDFAFDVLACGACILFPRLAFFAVSNNVVVLSLRAMITEFLFFIGIAAICFSGLLFTLWTLASGTWSVKGIAWLMIQIWFGNTYLSFAQAESFHKVFGPVLMTVFAALSNTLLLTILISILSNTVARIDARATQEYLFQFAISTIEGVKSDALFSYQPPFNILALLLLKPASYILSPRSLHSANVFLIKATSLPILILIGIYERNFAAGQRLRATGKDAAQSFFNSLPRHIKGIPLLEALFGSASGDLYEAIFDVDTLDADGLFGESEEEEELRPALRSVTSRDSLQPGPFLPNPRPQRRPSSLPRPPRGDHSSPNGSPRRRLASHLSPLVHPSHSAEIPSNGNGNGGSRSPLSLLFGSRLQPEHLNATDAVMKKMEAILEDMRGLPVQRLREEMKELQDRQARIENLLLVLTRGMRNETGYRSDTIS